MEITCWHHVLCVTSNLYIYRGALSIIRTSRSLTTAFVTTTAYPFPIPSHPSTHLAIMTLKSFVLVAGLAIASTALPVAHMAEQGMSSVAMQHGVWEEAKDMEKRYSSYTPYKTYGDYGNYGTYESYPEGEHPPLGPGTAENRDRMVTEDRKEMMPEDPNDMTGSAMLQNTNANTDIEKRMPDTRVIMPNAAIDTMSEMDANMEKHISDTRVIMPNAAINTMSEMEMQFEKRDRQIAHLNKMKGNTKENRNGQWAGMEREKRTDLVLLEGMDEDMMDMADAGMMDENMMDESMMDKSMMDESMMDESMMDEGLMEKRMNVDMQDVEGRSEMGNDAWYASYKPYSSYGVYPTEAQGEAARKGMAEGMIVTS
ncbi:hypothetical protein GQ43DRAFT_175043 [Delitschia confertaspora ATCC 74209]|uniref:Uncharacterized protein n=1 Tax=Delitschia confertaspora ATCC 74209 TaxID=1513339 RepID=A0A9P4MVL8_9PLEO|nr:hypothetical protein GQ43DRAFT_175043 [Delitschia confertaspora ATCC 74209]